MGEIPWLGQGFLGYDLGEIPWLGLRRDSLVWKDSVVSKESMFLKNSSVRRAFSVWKNKITASLYLFSAS